jgi:Fe-S-cluster containining protein
MKITAKENLRIPASAVSIHDEILMVLEALLAGKAENPLHPDFRNSFKRLLTLFHRFQESVMNAHGKRPSCTPGCACCCNHWVEDVYSFEASIIADHITRFLPSRIDAIIACCKADEKRLVVLDEIIEKKLSRYPEKDLEDIDRTDVLLAGFYQLERPCPLLRTDGRCGIYEVRPLTCRIYFSFSDPLRCAPCYINESDTPTYLLDMEEEASALLDALHDRYKRSDKTGLRALLIDYLT